MRLKSILLFASAITVAASSFGQTKVTTGGKKYTLMEEATGTWCQWCPDGMQVIEEDILPHGTDTTYARAIVASFHNGNSDSMLIRTPYSDPFSNGTPYIAGFPMGTVDRAAYGGNIGLSRGSWPPAVGARDILTPKFDVSMVCLYDSSTRIITIKVKAKALSAGTGPYRINAYITEDSISSAPQGYRQTVAGGLTAAGSTTATGNPTWFIGQSNPLMSPSIYTHMAAVRKILASKTAAGSNGGIWGDTVTKFMGAFAAGDSAEKTYYDTIPMTLHNHPCYKYHTNVIGLVQKFGPTTTGTDREIDNCIEAKVRYMWKVLPSTGVTDVVTMQDVKLYPNPANNYIVVKGVLENPSATKISIYNTVGQLVYSKEYAAGGSIFAEVVHIDGLSNGIYFMNIANEGQSITKEFSVSK